MGESKLVRAKIVCTLPKDNGLECIGNQTRIAKWYFDRNQKICRPFYYSGCGGNENKFDSWDECEEKCPNTFPPQVELLNKVLVVEEEFEALLDVTVEANPPPTIIWQKDGKDVILDERIVLLENGSLHISTSELDDTGTWTIIADNRLGQKARKQVTLNVYPSRLAIEVVVGKDQSVFQQDEDIKLTCLVKGYPIPSIMWYRNNIPVGKNKRFSIDQDNTLVIPKSRTIDTGSFSCRATNEHEVVSDEIEIFVKKPEQDEQCIDNPMFANCQLIVKAGFCGKNPYYSKFCCASCTEAGEALYSEVKEEVPEEEPSEEQEEIPEASEEEASEAEASEEEASGEEALEGEALEEEQEQEEQEQAVETAQDLEEEDVEENSEDAYGAYEYDDDNTDDVQDEYETVEGEVAEDMPEPEYDGGGWFS